MSFQYLTENDFFPNYRKLIFRTKLSLFMRFENYLQHADKYTEIYKYFIFSF